MNAKLDKGIASIVQTAKNVDKIENLFQTKVPAGDGKLEFVAFPAFAAQF